MAATLFSAARRTAQQGKETLPLRAARQSAQKPQVTRRGVGAVAGGGGLKQDALSVRPSGSPLFQPVGLSQLFRAGVGGRSVGVAGPGSG